MVAPLHVLGELRPASSPAKMAGLYFGAAAFTQIGYMQKTLDEKLARIAADPGCKRFHSGRCQGRRHGVWPGRAGMKRQPCGRQIAVPQHSGLPGQHSGDRRAAARRHHADEREHERRARGARAAVREEPDHAGDSRERHERHVALRHAGGVRQAAVDAVSHGDHRRSDGRECRRLVRSGQAAGQPGAVFDHAEQRCRRSTTRR